MILCNFCIVSSYGRLYAQESFQMLFWARKSKEYIPIDLELTGFVHFPISLRGKAFFQKSNFSFSKVTHTWFLKRFRAIFEDDEVWKKIKNFIFTKNDFPRKLIKNVQTLLVLSQFGCVLSISALKKVFGSFPEQILSKILKKI